MINSIQKVIKWTVRARVAGSKEARKETVVDIVNCWVIRRGLGGDQQILGRIRGAS